MLGLRLNKTCDDSFNYNSSVVAMILRPDFLSSIVLVVSGQSLYSHDKRPSGYLIKK